MRQVAARQGSQETVKTTNRIWRLNRHPDGHDFAAALSLESEAMPQPGGGQVLVRAK